MGHAHAIFDESKPIPGPAVNSAGPRHATPNSTANPDIGRQARRGLEILSRKVVQYWVHGILEQSLFLQTLHDLGMEMMAGAVANPWGTEVERPGEPSRSLTAGQSLVDVFDEYGGSLLILGEPGSGKTTVMLDLALLLVA